MYTQADVDNKLYFIRKNIEILLSLRKKRAELDATINTVSKEIITSKRELVDIYVELGVNPPDRITE